MGGPAYNGIDQLGYVHKPTNLKGRPRSDAHKLLPHVHRVSALLKRWWLGTHHGGIQPEHLDYYLDEFTFRFNRCTSRSRGLLFYRLLQQAVATGHVEYNDIVGGSPAAARRPPEKYVKAYNNRTRKKRPRRRKTDGRETGACEPSVVRTSPDLCELPK